MHLKKNIINDNISDNIMNNDIEIIDSIINNSENMYVNSEEDIFFSNIDDNFLFKEIINDSKNNKLNDSRDIDSECVSIEISTNLSGENDQEYIVIDYQEKIIDSIKNKIIENFIDNPNVFSQDHEKDIEIANDKYPVLTDAISSNNFFESFNDDMPINNIIPSNKIDYKESDEKKIGEMTTSYVFENDDYKKSDSYSFYEEIYEFEYKPKIKKQKNVISKLSVFATSVMMSIGSPFLT